MDDASTFTSTAEWLCARHKERGFKSHHHPTTRHQPTLAL
jgi:hypothetical protein